MSKKDSNTNSSNPLASHFRVPKLYTHIPSHGKFYTPDIMVMPDNGELAIYAMTTKDEVLMKNPDALLNGEAVTQIIKNCVPGVYQPRKLLINDVDALLVAIQAATYGDHVAVSSNCPKCKTKIEMQASVSAILEGMDTMEESYSLPTGNGLVIEVKPYTYASNIKAGIANFKSTRSLQSLQNIEDEMAQLKAFTASFVKIALLNFELLIESVASITIPGTDGDNIVTDRTHITEFLENCDGTIGTAIESKMKKVNAVGIHTEILVQCTNESCKHEFDSEVNFDPVNFSTAS